jgi:hypothetical protein
MDGTNGYFRRNSGCSAEQNFSEFRSEPFQRKRKHHGISFRGTEIEANYRNSLPNPSAEEKQLGIPFRGTEIETNSRKSLPNLLAEEKKTRNSVPNHSAEEKTTQNKTRQRQSPTVLKLKVLVETVIIGFHHPV